jgi:hypothetical protein
MLRRTIFALLIIFSLTAEARIPRSAAEVLTFKRANPCPSTGERRGSCPGYVVDHVVPLCAGGPDAVSNMQWQKYRESLVKDVDERRQCRLIKYRSLIKND